MKGENVLIQIMEQLMHMVIHVLDILHFHHGVVDMMMMILIQLKCAALAAVELQKHHLQW